AASAAWPAARSGRPTRPSVSPSPRTAAQPKHRVGDFMVCLEFRASEAPQGPARGFTAGVLGCYLIPSRWLGARKKTLHHIGTKTQRRKERGGTPGADGPGLAPASSPPSLFFTFSVPLFLCG